MLIIDFLLLIMIGVCIVYCWTLNRRIQDLQNSRIEFARMIKELNISIVKAETSVNELDTLSKTTTTELKNSIEEAKNAASELMMVNDISNELSEQLNEQVSAIKKDQDNNFLSAERESSPLSQRFSEEDFVPIEDEPDRKQGRTFYTNQLKNVLSTIIGKKQEDEGASMDQSSYYDTLRKISVKK